MTQYRLDNAPFMLLEIGTWEGFIWFYFSVAFFPSVRRSNQCFLNGWLFLWILEHVKYCGSLHGKRLRWGSVWLQTFFNTDCWVGCIKDLLTFIKLPWVEVCLSVLSVESKHVQYVAAEGNMMAGVIWIPHWDGSSKEISVTRSKRLEISQSMERAVRTVVKCL